ncbi:hypothetical protein [Acinetobacter sp. MB5]|uniref:hypothetical protein n=1 Tax=Acinetobacter sp. MB5 TaxID=2069438 RepID=UPI000DD056E9|nr:hypothetical protein [Acinetobacter sp. MB5]
MNNDDFAKKITQRLDHLADTHKDKNVVMYEVMEKIHAEKAHRHSVWKMTGFALAATLTGFLVLPNAFNISEKNHAQHAIVNNNANKLSPQMVEDLEMVTVFGEDQNSHGS